jgi:AcrR family transcriptional regulator
VVAKGNGEALLAQMASAALASTALPRAKVRHAVEDDFDDSAISPRASRREAVLAAAIELFAHRGYAGVRMEDVGAAAGITGPSVYQHFAGKADLLMAALNRGAEWLQLGLAQAFAATNESAAALELVLRSYVEFMLQHTDLMSVFLTETIYLPEEERHALRRVQHEYVAEWVRLLVAVRPSLTPAEGRFLVQGVLGVVNDNVHGQARRRPDLDEILVQLGLEMLDLGGLGEGR